MALFDFLKKKEFEKIKELENEVSMLSQYKGIVDVDKEIANKKQISERELANIQNKKEKTENEISELQKRYSEAHAVYQNLRRQNELFSESLDLAEYGVYEPHFHFETSDVFREKILSEREKQKQMIKEERAITGGNGISWNGSLSQGQAMVKREKKLMMRAFNGESDSFIASVDWNNVNKMEERINKSFEAINKVYEKQGISITSSYKYSKIHELYLSYEYKRKKQEEKEEQRQIREQMREEEKATREFEAARIKAEKEANDYQKAIEKAKIEAENTDGVKHEKLVEKIKELEERLKEAEANKERAMSMAQQTRRGHVYVISNIGSFGDNVYKIGMTRRLEPMDRVRELGDASVPFYFDVHAIIFSEDAPKLEHDLHLKFSGNRLNAVNTKKEFFSVSLSEIEQFVKETHSGEFEFTKIAEAKEYRETLSIKQKSIPKKEIDDIYPNSLFV